MKAEGDMEFSDVPVGTKVRAVYPRQKGIPAGGTWSGIVRDNDNGELIVEFPKETVAIVDDENSDGFKEAETGLRISTIYITSVPSQQEEKPERKFVQLITAPWEDEEGRTRTNLYGLTADGRVFWYRFARNNDGGWQELDGDYVSEYDETTSERSVAWR